MMRADLAVLACGSPIEFEGTEVISRILLRMLLPIWVGVPQGIRSFIVPMLDGGEELIYNPFFPPIPEVVHQQTGDYYQCNCSDAIDAAALFNSRIVFLGLEDRHRLKQTPVNED